MNDRSGAAQKKLSSRRVDRIVAPPSGLIRAVFHSGPSQFESMVADFSFEGARLILETPAAFSPGDRVSSVSVLFGNSEVGFIREAEVVWTRENTIGLSFLPAPAGARGTGQGDSRDERMSQRFPLDEALRPQFVFEDPIFPGEMIRGSLHDLSTSGMKLCLVRPAEHLLPKMQGIIVRIISQFLDEELQVQSKIEWVRLENQRVMLGMSFQALRSEELGRVLQLILSLSLFTCRSDAEMAELLEKIPRIPTRIRHFFRSRALQGQDELHRAWNLRYRAYARAGKIEAPNSTELLMDEQDRYSQTFGIFLGYCMVGTFRLTPSRSEQEPFPMEKIFEPAAIKAFCREGHVEVSKLALLPELQKTDGLIGLFQAVTREAAANRVDLYMCSTRRFRSHYQRLGAKIVSGARPHPLLKDETLTVLKIHSFDVLRGHHSGFFSWKYIVKKYYDAYSKVGWIARKTSYVPLFLRLFKEMPEVFRRQLTKKGK